MLGPGAVFEVRGSVPSRVRPDGSKCVLAEKGREERRLLSCQVGHPPIPTAIPWPARARALSALQRAIPTVSKYRGWGMHTGRYAPCVHMPDGLPPSLSAARARGAE